MGLQPPQRNDFHLLCQCYNNNVLWASNLLFFLFKETINKLTKTLEAQSASL
jgi:hypothetical protein